ncbi:MAG: hypothetical protein IIC82_00265, partial [Chloroflexi bacterium]|nr:hypothetical protein [Chloroflexota bacterium]
SRGAIHRGRENLSPEKQMLLDFTNREQRTGTVHEVLEGADVFIGVSVAGAITQAMVRSMARDPIIFAMANPVPEIMPEDARAAGAAVIGTGRSDFPNQINNCLAFPGIFRGALDVRAPAITTAMKIAAARALAGLVPSPTPERVIPWALDPLVVPAVAEAVRQCHIGAPSEISWDGETKAEARAGTTA